LVRRLNAQGFEVQAAVADTVGGAWAVAHYGARNGSVGYGADAPNPPCDDQSNGVASVVPVDQLRDYLASLPLAALRLAPEIVAALARVGLKRIADILDRPRAPLAARFGEGLIRRIDQALGHEDEPNTPRLPVPPYVVERRFAEPIARESDVLGTIE